MSGWNEAMEAYIGGKEPLPSAWDGYIADFKNSQLKSVTKQIADRFKVIPNEGFGQFMKYNAETLITPNQDIIKDYMHNTGSTFEEAMKWAVKQDAINWNRVGAMPRNFMEKYRNKQALESDGIKRIN